MDLHKARHLNKNLKLNNSINNLPLKSSYLQMQRLASFLSIAKMKELSLSQKYNLTHKRI